MIKRHDKASRDIRHVRKGEQAYVQEREREKEELKQSEMRVVHAAKEEEYGSGGNFI